MTAQPTSPSSLAARPGMLVLMGSGETTPTMVTVHQRIAAATAERRGVATLAAALLDTPYGFQSNAEEISEKARGYFSHNVGLDVNRLPTANLVDASAVDKEAALDAIRQLDWVFAGPGSPTYAVRQWRSGAFADAFAAAVARGGTVVLSSAAAVTAGEQTIPVYEIYKAGAPVTWAPGLGLTATLLGWSCVVIPHFDNAEGGTHDTRFCYLGEERLQVLEAELADEVWVLGIDEHTAAVIDLDADTVAVHGRGGLHVRRNGRLVTTFPAGTTVSLQDVSRAAAGQQTDQAADQVRVPGAEAQGAGADAGDSAGAESTLGERVDELDRAFDLALAGGDAKAATAAALALEEEVRAWSADTVLSADTDRAIAALRGMITRLGALAAEGMHDHTDLVRPLIESMLHVREDARARQAFEVADHIRDHMDADGIQVRDTREGTVWEWDEPQTAG